MKESSEIAVTMVDCSHTVAPLVVFGETIASVSAVSTSALSINFSNYSYDILRHISFGNMIINIIITLSL